MITKISGGKVILEDRVAEHVDVYYEHGVIRDVTAAPEPFDLEIDACGRYIAPGFVDIHTHGAGGADFMDGTPEAFLTAAEAHARHGVTTVLPTAAATSPEEVTALSRTLEQARAMNLLGADMPGLHLEGPYLAPGQSGAIGPERMRLPDPDEYLPLLGSSCRILRWTIAPELPGAPEVCRKLQCRGIAASIENADGRHAREEAAMDSAVRAMLRDMDVSMPEAVRLVSRAPARAVGLTDRGSIRPGLRADIVLFDEDVHVSLVIVNGRTVYDAGAETELKKQGGISHVE